MLNDLRDKVILITGASTGLGKAIALRLANDMPQLVLNARTGVKLNDTMNDVLAKGAKCSCFACDIADMDQTHNVIEYVMEAYGKIDVLINNAGIWHEGSTESHPKDKIKEMFQVNSIGVIYMTQEVMPIMRRQGYGQIFNIVSNSGIEPAANWGVYAATKFAVRGFTESIKLELAGTGIKVIGFYPGGMNTDLFETSGFPKGAAPWMMDKDDISEIVTFILRQPDDIVIDHVEVRKFLK